MHKIFIAWYIPCFGIFHVEAQSKSTNQRLYDTVPYIIEHNKNRQDMFAKEKNIIGATVFLGNSITEGGNWKKMLSDSTVVNRGIGGDITFGILQRLPEIIEKKPSKLFLKIGINDIAKDIPDTVIAENVRKIILIFQKKSPKTQIFIQSILPINSNYPGFPQHYDKQEHVILTNKYLKDITKDTGVTFIDLFPYFLDSQKLLDKKYTYDGLHLNQEGYNLWTHILKKNGYL
ncbi:MAG: GDSL-type esterase/lipase family protein [Chitinophagaceae bacterium]|nr:GDSL-type esterase/lipase family protein [Chitinophagaceae bacterium]